MTPSQRDEFLALVRDRMRPSLRGSDYSACFNAVLTERPDLVGGVNEYNADQPRDEQGRWSAEGGGGGAAKDAGEMVRRNAAIGAWAQQHGETGARELAGIERLVHKKGLSVPEAARQVYAKRARRVRSALGDDLYNQMKSEGKIKEGPPK